MSESEKKKGRTVRYSNTEFRRFLRESQARDLEPFSERGKGIGTFQALVDHSIELFLSVSPERYRAGDLDRLKGLAAELAGEQPGPVPVADPEPLTDFVALAGRFERVAEPEDLAMIEPLMRKLYSLARRKEKRG